MKYLVGKTQYVLNGIFRTRHYESVCIDAVTEEEALKKYALKDPEHSIIAVCIGIIDDDNRLLIHNFSKRYHSGKSLIPICKGLHYHLVTKLFDKPPIRSSHCLYLPMFVRTASKEDAITAYVDSVNDSIYPSYYIGYLDENDTFIVPNITDFIIR